MDFFKLGLRNILGITLPGAVLVLVVSYVLYVCTIALDQSRTLFEWVKDAELLILVASFIISYVIGSVIRLNSASNVDDKSAKFKRKEFWREKWKQAIKARKYSQVSINNLITLRKTSPKSRTKSFLCRLRMSTG